MTSLDIVNLITNNPITKLNANNNNKLLEKVKANFTEMEQQLFISNFYTYLNYDKTADFIVSFTDRTNGMIQISLASSITNQIKPGRYLYDILMTDNAGFKKIVTEGSVSVRPGISTNFS